MGGRNFGSRVLNPPRAVDVGGMKSLKADGGREGDRSGALAGDGNSAVAKWGEMVVFRMDG